MVCKNNKNSKKKINDLKPVIKTSYKKVNRKQNTKQIGGGAWGEFKEWSQKTVGRYKGVGVKNEKGAIKFFTRQERGLSRFKVGHNYRSGKQIENRVNYVTAKITEKKQQFTKVQNKLSGKQFKFDRIVDNKFKKVEIEIATEQANLSQKLAQKKITKDQFNEGVEKLANRKTKILDELNKEKTQFLEKHTKLINKMEKKRKEFIKISDKYKPKIEKLTLKLQTKVRKANKLLDKGLYRTCKKSPNKGCFSQLKTCRANTSNISKPHLLSCMNGIEGFDQKSLDKNILKIKWYNSPSRRRKIRARSKRIERLPETQKIQNDYGKIQKEVSNIKNTRISNTHAINQILERKQLKQLRKSEAQDFAEKELSNLETGMESSITKKTREFNGTIATTKKAQGEAKEAAQKQLNKATKEAAEKVAAEKVAKEAAEAEKVAAEKVAKEAAEAEKLAKEAAEAEKVAAEKVAAEKVAAEKVAKEAAEAEKVAAEKVAAEKVAKEAAEAEKVAAEKVAKESTV